MQNHIQKFKQSSIACEKPGILSGNLNIFCWNFARISYLTMSTKVCGIFLILLRSSVICEKLKRPGFYTLVYYIFVNNSRSTQNEKNPAHSFVDIIK